MERRRHKFKFKDKNLSPEQINRHLAIIYKLQIRNAHAQKEYFANERIMLARELALIDEIRAQIQGREAEPLLQPREEEEAARPLSIRLAGQLLKWFVLVTLGYLWVKTYVITSVAVVTALGRWRAYAPLLSVLLALVRVKTSRGVLVWMLLGAVGLLVLFGGLRQVFGALR